MFVSVIICTHNRARLLRRALHCLARQTVSAARFEVLVVDDGSEDNTAAICDAMQGQELPNLRYISAGGKVGLGKAANLGIRHAKGDHVLFTDDDCIAQPDWVERMSTALRQESVVAGAVSSLTSDYIKLCHNIGQFHAFMPGRKACLMEFAAGANMGARRSVLEELGGFRELEIALDTDFILRARSKGYRVYFASDAVVQHDPDRNRLMTILKYSSDHASATILLRNQYRLLLRTPFVLRSPLLTLLAAPLIALRVTLGIYMGNANLARLFRTAPVVYALKLCWCWGAARGLREWRRAGVAQ